MMFLAVLVTAVLFISLIVLTSRGSFLKFFKKDKEKKPKKKEIDISPIREDPMDAASDFMVSSTLKRKKKQKKRNLQRRYIDRELKRIRNRWILSIPNHRILVISGVMISR
jgi:hypothetical protein